MPKMENGNGLTISGPESVQTIPGSLWRIGVDRCKITKDSIRKGDFKFKFNKSDLKAKLSNAAIEKREWFRMIHKVTDRIHRNKYD